MNCDVISQQKIDPELSFLYYSDDVETVLIIDAMTVVQGLKKTPDEKKCWIYVTFSKGFTETRSENAAAVYHVHENMSLQSLKLKDILSTRTKQGLTKYLTDSLLVDFQGKIIVVQGRQARGSNCDVHE